MDCAGICAQPCPLGGETTVNTTTFDFQVRPAVAASPDGNFFAVAWASFPVLGASPDGDIGDGEKLDRNRILAAGENGWSYFEGLTNTSAVRHPLVLGPFTPEGVLQDDLWEGKALLLTVDSSARSQRIDPDGVVRELEGVEVTRPGNPGRVFREGFTPVLRHPAAPNPR